MDDNEARALGVRAIQAGMTWRPGTLVMLGTAAGRPPWASPYEPGRYRETTSSGALMTTRNCYPPGARRSGWLVPDLRCPLTLGGLLADVRERWGMPDLTTCAGLGPYGDLFWEVEGPRPDTFYLPEQYASEAEALVAALKAAPPGTP